jgi:hypothetical protein
MADTPTVLANLIRELEEILLIYVDRPSHASHNISSFEAGVIHGLRRAIEKARKAQRESISG